jgi:hypothetical protein
VTGQREGVHHHGPPEHLDLLAAPAEAVSPPQKQGVLEGPVQRLGVVPAAVEPSEVRIRRREGANVLGPVEPPAPILLVLVQANRDLSASQVFGQPVVATKSRSDANRTSGPGRPRRQPDSCVELTRE